MKEFTLTSGAILKMGNLPFSVSKSLLQAVFEEIKSVKISSQAEILQVAKDIFCAGITSKKVEIALAECFKKCIYCDKRGELKIDDDTFEPSEAREDYIEVCTLVMKESLTPFSKSLFVQLKMLLGIIEQSRQ
jgi:hypothetical protein